jgi:3-methyladenine DNA glycosylase AlkD
LINKESISQIEKIFAAHADKAKEEQMAAYMKNHFSFYGIQKPLRQNLSKELIKTYSKLAFTEIILKRLISNSTFSSSVIYK